HQAAQMLGLNLYEYLRMRMSGVGTVQVSFYGNDLSNPFPIPPAFPPPAVSTQDAELGMNVVAERVAIGFQAFPTNVQRTIPVSQWAVADSSGAVWLITIDDSGLLHSTAAPAGTAAQVIKLTDS